MTDNGDTNIENNLLHVVVTNENSFDKPSHLCRRFIHLRKKLCSAFSINDYEILNNEKNMVLSCFCKPQSYTLSLSVKS